MSIEQITDYTFDPRNGKVTLNGLPVVEASRVIAISNRTRRTSYFNQGYGRLSVTGKTITLPIGAVDVGDSADDELSIRYDTTADVAKPSGGWTESDLSPEIQQNLEKAAVALNQTVADATYASKQGSLATVANASRSLNKLNRGIDPVTMLYVGDSTGNEQIEHIYLEAVALGAQFPRYTVLYRLWNDTTKTYDAAVTVQTGTGTTPPVLTIWNCSVSGFATFHFIGDRFTPAFESLVDPDLILISHSHNMLDVSTANLRAGFRSNILALTEELTQIFPDAGLLLMSQNPTYVAGRETWQSIKATELQGIAARHGYGFIDVHQAFMDTGNPKDYVKSDNVHPTTSADAPAPNGSVLWANTVMASLGYAGAVASPSQRPSYFMEPGRSLIPNTEFATWTAPEMPDGWTLVNCLAEKDTVNFETGSFGLKLTAVATGASYAQFSASPASLGIKGLTSGKLITVGMRVFVPTTNTIAGTGLMIRDQGGSTTQRRVDISSSTRNRFFWVFTTKRIDAPGTNLTIQLSPQWSGTFAATNTITVDRIRVIEGDIPRFA